MRHGWFAIGIAALSLGWRIPARAQTSPFDGVWGVTVSCPPIDDAAGYTLRFPARVTGGKLLGENRAPGEAGYLLLSGQIQPDGSAALAADGLVGNPRDAIGHVPSLTRYRYVAASQFAGNRGKGTRTSTRPCTLEFLRS